MTSEKAVAADPAESPKSAGVRELLRLLVKTLKAHRLYESKNAVSERLERVLFERLTGLVAEWGEIHLTVQESRLRFEDEVVYESSDRNDSLAFLLYRDGIRRLSFGAGLELEELRAFLRCLNRVALLSNDQDDLVTLLWEQDLHAIRYFAIEELAGNQSYTRLEEQLSTGDAGGEAGGVAGESVSLDLEQPVSTIPVEACRLEPGEIETLQKELEAEEKLPFRTLVSELALELVLLEDLESEHDEIQANLVVIADRLIADGHLAELVGIHEHIDGLTSMVFRSEARAQNLATGLTRALTEPERLEKLLEKVEAHLLPKPDALTSFLARLGPAATPSLISWMGRFSSPAYRRAVTTALLFSEDGGLSVLRSSLPLGAPPADSREQLRHRQFVREVIFALTRHPSDKALPLLEQLLRAPDLETRRESFVASSRYPDERVVTLCLERLGDGDPEVRSLALDTLVRRGRTDLGLEILRRALADPSFDGRSLNEKRRIFAAIAKLSGESALDPLRRLLLERDDRWFASQKDRQFAEAVSHGIRVVGTPAARAALEELARNGPRFVRGACVKELGGGRS